MAALILTLGLLPAFYSAAQAQNQILIVSDNPEMIGDTAVLDSIARDLSFNPVYGGQIPFQLETQEYSLLIIPEFKGVDCQVLRDYLLEGGCLLLTGAAPLDLFLDCNSSDSVSEWIGFGSYINGSGELVAAIDLDQIELPRDSLLDRTPCNRGFGGLGERQSSATVLAKWFCPQDSTTAAAITVNPFGRGKLFFFSRALSTVRVRELFKWALAEGVEYRWGDADNSGRINITDAVYIIRIVFDGGPWPAVPNAGDPNADGSINISDAVWLINYIFNSGSAPRAGRVD
jgi:hypothetical protein